MATLHGINIYENPYLTEREDCVVKKSLQERWITPLLHPVTVPFEPWVKTKTITVTVPSKKIFQTAFGLVMHPLVAAELRKRGTDERHVYKRNSCPFSNEL